LLGSLFFVAPLPYIWLNEQVKRSSFFDSKHLITFAFIAIFAFSAFFRFYHLSKPSDQVFDEVYFPVFAHDYITHTDFFDSHPPLGKLIIAGGELVIGNDPLGWRLMNAITGLLLLGVIAGFTYSLTKRWQAALLATFLVAIDPMALVESRIGVINIYLAFFSLLSLWFFWRWWQGKQKPFDLALACLSFGFASAVKWIGIGALGASVAYIIAAYILRFAPPIKWRWTQLFYLLLIPLAYLVTFIPDLLHGQDFWWWHSSAYNYHAHLTATHPYGSNWWSWPIVYRPLWLYYKTAGTNMVTGMIEIGNVVTWIGGLIILVGAMLALLKTYLRRWTKDTGLVSRNAFLFITYVALYLPWIAISRVKFIYHYFVPVLLLLVFLGITLDDWFKTKSPNRIVAWFILGSGLAFFLFFLPLLLCLPISMHYYQMHMWFRNWI
jgi:dolichyl-phosphate-mannose--protein O-mannosyl transferase